MTGMPGRLRKSKVCLLLVRSAFSWLQSMLERSMKRLLMNGCRRGSTTSATTFRIERFPSIDDQLSLSSKQLVSGSTYRYLPHCNTSRYRPSQLHSITSARRSCSYRFSPTPIAAGKENSAALTAMWEFDPPYFVMRPAMSWPKSQSEACQMIRWRSSKNSCSSAGSKRLLDRLFSLAVGVKESNVQYKKYEPRHEGENDPVHIAVSTARRNKTVRIRLFHQRLNRPVNLTL